MTKPRSFGPWNRTLSEEHWKSLMLTQAGVTWCLLEFLLLRILCFSCFLIYTSFWFCDLPYILPINFLLLTLTRVGFYYLQPQYRSSCKDWHCQSVVSSSYLNPTRSMIKHNKMDSGSVELCSTSGSATTSFVASRRQIIYLSLNVLLWKWKYKSSTSSDCISA